MSRVSPLLLVLGILLLLFSSSVMNSPDKILLFSTQKVGFDPTLQQGSQPDFQMQIEPNQFLMRTGTGGTPGLVFTPLNGFAGNVTLSATISPLKPSGPTISSIPGSVKLNASIGGSPSYFMGINTTLGTPLGLYTVTVYGVSGSITNVASATIGVVNVFIPSNGAELLYSGNFTTAAYAGQSATLNSTFEDLGYVAVGVWNVTLSTAFGTFRDTSGDHILGPYEEGTFPLTFGIPANTSPGNYSVTVTIRWFLGPGTIYQTSGPDLTTHGSIIVYSNAPRPPGPLNLSGLATILLGAIGGVVAAAAIMFVLLTLVERRRKNPFQSQVKAPVSSAPLQPGAATKSCSYCGQTVPVGEFCAECGSRLY
jgi:hypothetical protein